jgi:hypothetical protein
MSDGKKFSGDIQDRIGPFQQFFRLGVVSWEAPRAKACREEHRDDGSRRNGDSDAESVAPTVATSTFS